MTDEYRDDLTDNEDLISDVTSVPPSDCDNQLTLAPATFCAQYTAPCICLRIKLKQPHNESRTNGWLDHLSNDNDTSNPSGSCYELSSLNVDQEKVGISYRSWAKIKQESNKVGFIYYLPLFQFVI